MSTYAEKTSERVGRPLDAAATVRPRNGVSAVSLCAGTPTDELMRIGYGELTSVQVDEKTLVKRCEVVLGDGCSLELEGGKFGVGSCGETVGLAERSVYVREPT